MNTVTLSIKDAVEIGCLLETLLGYFDDRSADLANHICNDIAAQIPPEYYYDANQLEFNFIKDL